MKNLNQHDIAKLEQARKSYVDMLKKISPYLVERAFTKHAKYSKWDAVTNPILKSKFDDKAKESTEE